MALSGNTYTAFKDHRLVFEWSATQNIPQNTSTVKVNVFLQGMQSWSTLYAPANNNGSITVNGSTQYFTANSNLTGTQKKLLATRSFSVGHNANGTKSFSFSSTYNVNVNYNGYVGNVTVSGSGTLNTIPRATGIKVTTPSFDYGGNLGFTLTQPIAGFNYRVDVNIAGWSTSASYSGTGGAGQKYINIPVSWAQRVPNATQATGSITVTTLSGSSSIGTASGSYRVNVGAGIVPKITAFTISEKNPKLTPHLPTNKMLQSVSMIEYSGTAVGAEGSTISSYTASVGAVTSTGASGALSLARDVNVKGNVNVTFEVKDSRNRVARQTIPIEIIAYSPPQIISAVGNRNENGKGGSVIVQRSGKITPVIIDGKDINKITASIENKITTATAWKVVHNSTNFDNVTIPNIGVTYSYDFKVNLSDLFSDKPISATFAVSTAKTLLHLNEDKGIGVGAMHERGVLDVTGDSYFEGSTNIKGNTSINGNLLISGETELKGRVNLSADLNITQEGVLTLTKDRYVSSTTGAAMNFNNSDAYGINGLYFGAPGWKDPADNDGEGLLFPHRETLIPEDGKIDRSSGWDSFRVINGEGFLNSKLIFIEDSSKPLWEGGMYMVDGHRISPSRHLEGCPNGWILQWSEYANGQAQNYNYNYTVVHKGQYKTANSAGVYHTLSNSQNSSCGKYLYISNTTISGHANNNVGTSGKFVLRRVYAF